VAAETEFNAVDTAGALDKMAMAGLTSGQSMALLKGTTNLATATCVDLTTAVDIATDALGAFNMTKDEFGRPLDEAGLKTNLDRISDVVARTTNMFNTDIGMWFESVQKGAPVFTKVGQSLEDFSAMVGVLANSGIKGAEAGTALRNVITGLTPSSDKAAEALENMGIRVKDSAGNMNNIIDIIGDFEKVMGGTDIARDFKIQVDALAPVEGLTIEDQIEGL
jgi:TP901 family phage tail tape measure protein